MEILLKPRNNTASPSNNRQRMGYSEISNALPTSFSDHVVTTIGDELKVVTRCVANFYHACFRFSKSLRYVVYCIQDLTTIFSRAILISSILNIVFDIFELFEPTQ